jgi:hypothetical protein
MQSNLNIYIYISMLNQNIKPINKKKIKVFVQQSPLPNSNGSYIYKDAFGNSMPSGFTYDIWTIVKNTLKHKYDFEEIFSNSNFTNYDNFAEKIGKDEYDIVIGLFIPSVERNKLANMTIPIMLSYNTILMEKQDHLFSRFTHVVKHSLWYILYLLILGIIFGFIFFGLEIKSFKNIKNKLHIRHFKKLLLTSIIAFFGQKSILLENTNSTLSSSIFVILTMIISFIIILFVQGIITNINVNYRNTGKIDKSEFKTMKIIGLPGYAICKKLERNGINYIPIKDKTLPQLVSYYLNNTDKYDGVCMISADADRMSKQFPNTEMSEFIFGSEFTGWIINKQQTELLSDVNKVLFNLKKNNIISRICKSYFTNHDVCA